MTLTLKVLFLILALKITFAASDYEFLSFECESKDNSSILVKCSISQKSGSLSFNYLKPQNKLMVLKMLNHCSIFTYRLSGESSNISNQKRKVRRSHEHEISWFVRNLCWKIQSSILSSGFSGSYEENFSRVHLEMSFHWLSWSKQHNFV